MNTATLDATAVGKPHRQAVLDWSSVAIWLGASTVAMFFALLVRDGPLVGGDYAPFGNDSFYHARRILDAAVGTRGFYQFDERVEAPEGMWIPWPWGYDYLVAQATRLAVGLWPGLDPFTFVAHVSVVWILVNAALFLAAARTLGLSTEMCFLAMLGFALSPLTQLLHALGNIDHHIVEHTFVLLTIWLGLRWFQQPHEPRRAAALAVALGLAPAFHNGLFILQLLPLATAVLLWVRGTAPSARALYVFGAVLVSATQLILLPSEPYRNGLFEFGLLSWFHFYVAVCTAAAMAFMAWHPYSRGSLAGLAVLCVLLAAPLSRQILDGVGFLSASFSRLDQILEARSPYRFIQTLGLMYTVRHYSWLLLIAPALLLYFGYRLLRETEAERVYYAVAVVFGLALFLDQLRFHYFGFFAFLTAGLWLVDQQRAGRGWHRGGVFVIAFATIVLAYQPALHGRIFVMYAPGADTNYPYSLSILHELEKQCAKDPGLVLADSNDGSPILFHSECSVIANNFILTPEDHRHNEEVHRLMRLPPEELRAERPDIKYVFLRTSSFGLGDATATTTTTTQTNTLADALRTEPLSSSGFTLLRGIYRDVDAVEGLSGLYARLYKLD